MLRKRKWPKCKADQNSKNRTEEERANLSDAQFTGNHDAQRNGRVWWQNRGKSEGYEKSEIKKNTQGTNSKGKETRTQINGLDQKGERNIQP